MADEGFERLTEVSEQNNVVNLTVRRTDANGNRVEQSTSRAWDAWQEMSDDDKEQTWKSLEQALRDQMAANT